MSAFKYVYVKGLGARGHTRKTMEERFLTFEQVQQVLDAAVESKNQFNQNWYRDYAAIFMGYSFGLRIGEVRLLERRHFSELASKQVAHLPTLKQRERIPVVCAGTLSDGRRCGKRVRVSVTHAGGEWPCPRCGHLNKVEQPKRAISLLVPEKDPPIIETQTIEFVLDYMENYMRPEQRYFFPNNKGLPMSERHMARIFQTHTIAAGFSPKYSFHALRHGRGSRIWNLFKDRVMVRDSLRQKSTAMADVYSHMDPDEIKRAKRALERRSFTPIKRTDNHNETGR